jgi:uncharacterized protein involved in outer membrane biogenesis
MAQQDRAALAGEPHGRRMRRGPLVWALGLGIPAILIVGTAIVWNWDWFIPLIEPRVSAAIGRKVTIAHLHVHLGRRTKLVADGVQIDDPAGFPSATPFVRVAQLGITVDVVAYVLHREIDIPLIDLKDAKVEAIALPSGQDNYSLHLASGGGSSPAPKIGRLTIEGGQVHVVLPKLKADFQLAVQTKAAAGVVAQHGEDQEIAVDAHGSYAAQPVTGTLIAGGLLSLQKTAQPYPVDLHLANGSTHVSLVGTVQDLLAFAGADLQLDLAGEDMANLYPLTGIPIPSTPKYEVRGQLAYADGKIRFDRIDGTVGHSDIEGSVAEAPGQARPDVTMDLSSRQVDLVDLGGFIGAKPARATPEERRAPEPASEGVLPTTPIDIPKLQTADIHLHYKADRIEGRSIPLDQLTVAMDVVDGAITLHPVSFKVGTGDISGDIAITPLSDKRSHLKATIDFNHVDVARLMAATHLVTGAGSIGGKAEIDATGNSIASWAADGNGGLTLTMAGGNLSAVLVSLSGLEFGNAVIAALGVPQQTSVRCFVGDWGLRSGIVDTRTLMLDTGVAIVRGAGTVDLRDERLDYRISAKPKHFTIGSIPTPIDITGTLRDPTIRPQAAPLLERGAAAAVLSVVAPPLALLATIQLGVKDPHDCADLVDEAKQEGRTGQEGAPLAQQTSQPAAPAQASPGRGFPFNVTGKGDAAVRDLNQEELNRIAKQRQ